MDLWTLTHSSPRGMASRAERAERAGWAGLCVVDSQCLAGDAYVALALAAGATSRLRLGTGVTNSITRHPAVTAAAAASLQQASEGRVEIGIGRGDSALAHLGRSPAPTRQFERYVDVVQRYLRGEAVAFEALAFSERDAPAVTELGLADTPAASRLVWLSRSLPKVALDVAATGPKVIGIGARLADRVLFSLGAAPERLSWGIEVAESAVQGARPRYGAYVNMVCHPHLETARSLVRGSLTAFARFAVMHGRIAGPVDEGQRRVLDALHGGYDMKQHTRADSSQAERLPPEFVDRYAIVGPPERCIERLKELEALGIEKVVVAGPTVGADREASREAVGLLEQEVVPVFAQPA